ncbi:hypothetical protein [Halogranum rubrum]|uniref:Uncharacterized protein n=1 Tax=Halogranum salarium B-1 TaxID=1210908 RepID=J3EZD2_9EURY|nr:hypothetical protein [Halogranum salarium]EJN60937.1 hypothetical protein HSB1_15400 [Halogranum salarium B-1]
MNLWVDVARLATAVNVLVLASLAILWGRNYAAMRSKHVLGLFVFATFLLAENAAALYYYQLDPTLSVWFRTAVPAVAWQAMLALHVLETVGLTFLAWVTWD